MQILLIANWQYYMVGTLIELLLKNIFNRNNKSRKCTKLLKYH